MSMATSLMVFLVLSGLFALNVGMGVKALQDGERAAVSFTAASFILPILIFFAIIAANLIL